MNSTYNDYGALVSQIGMTGSDHDIENRFPKTLQSIKTYYKSYPYAKAYELIFNCINRLKVDNFTKKRISEVSGMAVYYEFTFN